MSRRGILLTLSTVFLLTFLGLPWLAAPARAVPEQYFFNYTNESATFSMPIYYNNEYDLEQSRVEFNFGLVPEFSSVLITGMDFKYCGSGIGNGPYAMDVHLDATVSHEDAYIWDLPYTTGDWYNLSYIGPSASYLFSNNFFAYFYGVNSSTDCPALLGHNDTIPSNSSYGDASNWYTASGEYLVKLKYEIPTYLPHSAIRTGMINSTHAIDAYYVAMPRAGPSAIYPIMLNRTSGSGNINMRLIRCDDIIGDNFDSTSVLAASPTSGTTFPKYINHTEYHSDHQQSNLLLLVEAETPGVDEANYTVIYGANPPVSPSLLDVSPKHTIQHSITVSWYDSYELESLCYNVYRETFPITDVSTLTPITSVTALNYTDVLPAYDTYYYAVTAVSCWNESSPAGYILDPVVTYAPLPSVDYDVHPNPTSIGDTIYLNWTAITGATSYKIYRETIFGQDVSLLTPVGSTSALNYWDTLPSPGTYYYSVQACNALGDGLCYSWHQITYTAPTTLSLDPIVPNTNYNGFISLSWSTITGASAYSIYRNTTQITSLTGQTLLCSTGDDYYVDMLPSGVYGNYYYVVVATDWVHTTSMSNCVAVSYIPPPTPPPPHLQPISPNPTSKPTIDLEWNYVPEAYCYYVYTNTSEITDVTLLSPIQTCYENYFSTYLSGYGTHYFVVTSWNGTQGEGLISNCVNVSYHPKPVLSLLSSDPSFDGSVSLSWNAISGATEYLVYRSSAPITSVAGLTPITTTTDLTYTDQLTSSGTYYYTIVASTPTGDTPLAESVNITYTAPRSFGIPGASPILLLGIIMASVGMLGLKQFRKRHEE